MNALKEYFKCIELDPTVVAYYSNAATASSRLGEHERAVEMATEAIKLQPSFTKV